MFYIDYTWQLSNSEILLDKELDIGQLEWEEGNCFRLEKRDGRNVLVKIQSENESRQE